VFNVKFLKFIVTSLLFVASSISMRENITKYDVSMTLVKITSHAKWTVTINEMV